MLNTPKYSGEPTPQALASGLATLGRYGDEFMVHAAEGETVIPPEIFEANPQLKADLFRQMAMMGIKDPNRYVVGNSLNSINPITGQPEFFFKKIFKSIKKVFKKALPIIAPIVGNLLLPGIGGLIASGLVTKLQGGSWGDVLKSVAFSYAGSALTSGLSGAFSSAPGATFMGGLTKGLTAPFTAASNLFSSGAGAGAGAASGVAGGIGGGAVYGPSAGGTLPSGFNSSGVAGGIGGGSVYGPSAASPVAPALADGMTASGGFGDFSGSLSDIGGTDLSPGYDALGPTAGAVRLQTLPELQAARAANTEGPFSINNEFVSSNLSAGAASPEAAVVAPQEVLQRAAPEDGKGFFQDAGDYVGEKGQDFLDYVNPSKEAAEIRRFGKLEDFQKRTSAEYFKVKGVQIPKGTLEDASFEFLKNTPEETFLSRIAPAAALTAGAYAAYDAYGDEEEAFLSSERASQEGPYKAYDEWKGIADKNSLRAQELFGIWNLKPYETRSAFERATGGPSSRPDWRFLPESNTMTAAMGGEVVGPGTGTSDSIPARLSDGEFVMTADAVRNAGGGNRDLGAARMYDMMRRFEGGVA